MCLHGRLAQNTRCAVDTQAIGVQAVALSRVRGLKPFAVRADTDRASVALSRVRGLKLSLRGVGPLFNGRTLTSAWIETMDMPIFSSISFVALSRVRGLKRHVLLTLDFDAGRTLTSAWIETSRMNQRTGNGRVALSRVRGLKLFFLVKSSLFPPVALSRVRGLKPQG